MDKERPGRYVISTPGTGTQVCPILKLVLCATPHCPHKSLSLTERQDPWVAAGGDTTREKAYKPISQPMRELRAPPYAELQRWKKRQQVSKSSKTLHTCSHTHTHTHTHAPHQAPSSEAWTLPGPCVVERKVIYSKVWPLTPPCNSRQLNFQI